MTLKHFLEGSWLAVILGSVWAHLPEIVSVVAGLAAIAYYSIGAYITWRNRNNGR